MILSAASVSTRSRAESDVGLGELLSDVPVTPGSIRLLAGPFDCPDLMRGDCLSQSFRDLLEYKDIYRSHTGGDHVELTSSSFGQVDYSIVMIWSSVVYFYDA